MWWRKTKEPPKLSDLLVEMRELTAANEHKRIAAQAAMNQQERFEADMEMARALKEIRKAAAMGYPSTTLDDGGAGGFTHLARLAPRLYEMQFDTYWIGSGLRVRWA